LAGSSGEPNRQRDREWDLGREIEKRIRDR